MPANSRWDLIQGFKGKQKSVRRLVDVVTTGKFGSCQKPSVIRQATRNVTDWDRVKKVTENSL
jgi:hypothetical protein